VSFPDDRRIARFGEPFARERKRSVPAPGVDADHANTTFQQPERRLAAETAPAVEVIETAISLPSRSVDQHDSQRLQRVADAVEFHL